MDSGPLPVERDRFFVSLSEVDACAHRTIFPLASPNSTRRLTKKDRISLRCAALNQRSIPTEPEKPSLQVKLVGFTMQRTEVIKRHC